MQLSEAKAHAEMIRTMADKLNAAIQRAADEGMAVEVDVDHVRRVEDAHDRPILRVTVTVDPDALEARP